MPVQCLATVSEKTMLTNTIFSLKIEAPEITASATAGQFVHIKCGEDNLLRRPISISDAIDGVLTLVFEVRGAGTGWLSERHMGDQIDILGPLGRGFDLSYKNLIVVGGGIGVPPMLFASRKAPGRLTAVLGFKSKDNIILEEDLRSACHEVYITTEDGSAFEHGNVSLPLRSLLEAGGYDAVLACGPRAMLKAVAALSKEFGVPCQVSLEERMGCGVGACLVCACKTQENGREQMRRVCKDGPVFPAEEVRW